MKRILSEKHSIGTYLLNKISLSCFDDKRFILDDGINRLAYGHKDIKLSRIVIIFLLFLLLLFSLLSCYYCFYCFHCEAVILLFLFK